MATVDEHLRDAVVRFRASGSESPRLDAEVLLANVLGIDRSGLRAHPDAPVGDGQATQFAAAVSRREAGEPVAYLRGVKEFLGLAFASDERALIPRPETERLVQIGESNLAERLISEPRPAGDPPLRVVDIGTGSGAIAVSLAVRLRIRRMIDEVDILAVDDDPGALDLAKENAVAHAIADRMRFAEADLVPPSEAPFDLILANLPYIADAAMADLPAPVTFEPRHALAGGPDGLAVIARLVAILPEVLTQRGLAVLEIGADQEAGIERLVAALPGGWNCSVERDLAGLPRTARIER